MSDSSENAIIMNQSGLPDHEVAKAVDDQWEVISEQWVELSAFGFNPMSQGGYVPRQRRPQNMFVRSDYRMPQDPLEEMELAQRLVEEDDDVSNTVGMMSSVAFSGMKNLHPDPKTNTLFNGIAREINLDLRLRELYEQLLTVGNVYTVTIFERRRIPNFLPGPDPEVVVPAITFLNPLSVRVVSDTTFNDPILIQEVDDQTQAFLSRLNDPKTPGAEKRALRLSNPIAASLYIAPFEVRREHQNDILLTTANNAWYLNPKMVTRYTLTSNSSTSKYAPLTLRRTFGLCEAKRMLNLLDYSLLNGAVNFLIVVRKGSDAMPAHPLEIQNLQEVVKQASRSGIMVGDHRLSVDIIMPNMDVLLDEKKRSLLGRKISKAILRVPDFDWGRSEGGGTPDAEIASRVMMSDRLLIKRLIERHLYQETVTRNPTIFTKGSPKLWFPPITLAGQRFFNEQLLKLRDRGDISRSTAIEATGLDPVAEMAQKEWEQSSGFDDLMVPENVPSTGSNPMNDGPPSNVTKQDALSPTTGTEQK